MAEVVKIKRPTQRQYNAAEIDLALSIVSIRPCDNCGWPVDHSGPYIAKCDKCGHEEPHP